MCSDFNTSGQAMAIEPTCIVNSNRNLAKNVEAQCSSPAKYLVWDYFQKIQLHHCAFPTVQIFLNYYAS